MVLSEAIDGTFDSYWIIGIESWYACWKIGSHLLTRRRTLDLCWFTEQKKKEVVRPCLCALLLW